MNCKITYNYINYRAFLIFVMLFMALVLTGCATFNDDPLEDVNRPIQSMNDTLDGAILKPSAQFYRYITPRGVRSSVNNFFDNLNEPYSALNSILQGEFYNAGKNIGRFVINSTIGIFGLFDVAGVDMDIKANQEDFGQTLGSWGVNTGPYLVIPFLGPNNLRDTLTRFTVDSQVNVLPNSLVPSGNVAYAYYFFHGVRARERLLDAERFAQGMSLDKYVLYRSLSKQSRLNQVYNGNPPNMIDKDEDESWLDE